MPKGNIIDYMLHAVFGMVVFYLFGIFFVLACALGKELFDYYDHKKVDYYDILFTILIPIIWTILRAFTS